ncbi:MAG: hypothetical protein IH987_18960 [Planctomycetes bacterium]|nr:hypothetical protein [Planctomycetota bacterium]
MMFWRGLSSKQDRTSALIASDKNRTIDRLEYQRRPQYDAELRELRYGDALLKRFSQPAANQVLILQVFEECRWPNRIDSPLPPTKSLPNTVRDLNRNMKSELVRFRLDGEGNGVVWELTAPA